MCGLTGFFDFSHQTDSVTLEKMTDSLAYRGPDGRGCHFENLESGTLGLGHRRLSILDLSSLGAQPYHYNDYILIFNGEIYNFKEIRSELEKRGVAFESNSDTEVIIKSYATKGLACVDDFIGMFAFVIFDKKQSKIHLVRDRAGVKPLYFYWKDDLFLFSSELKAFHEVKRFKPEIEEKSIHAYLQYSYIPTPYSIFKNTSKIKPGHILTLDLEDKSLNEKKYWDVVDVYNKPKTRLTEAEAEEELERILISACNYRMVSDVPVGVFLSGGYDSSCVTSILAKHHSETIKTFTIGFQDKGFDEAPYAKKISEYLGTEHTEYYCTHREAADIIPKLPEIYDEPLGDNSVIPTTLVSQLARKNVTVALSSDAGDELFAGYPRYQQALKYNNLLFPAARKILSSTFKHINPEKLPYFNRKKNFSTRFEKVTEIWEQYDPIKAMEIVMQFNTDKSLRKMIPGISSHSSTYFDDGHLLNGQNDWINKMLAIDYLTFLLDNNLTKVDRATMSVSLEGREPLLDHRLTEFVASLPSDYKLKNGDTKYLFRKVIYKYLPKSFLDRPKQGFVVPIQDWFKEDLKEYVSDLLSFERIKQQDIFDPTVIQNMVNNYLSGKGENVQKIWHLLVFQLWYYRWIEKS